MKRTGAYLAAIIFSVMLCGCSTKANYMPDTAQAPVSLNNFSQSETEVVVTDSRADKSDSEALATTIRQHVLSFFTGDKSAKRFIEIDIKEHVASFSGATWTGTTILTVVVKDAEGLPLADFTAQGNVSKHNWMGSLTAKSASQEAYISAISALAANLADIK